MEDGKPAWETRQVPAFPDVLAPDGSAIRLLGLLPAKASFVHCTLQPGQVTRAVTHRTVEEFWYFLGGTGQVWRSDGEREEVTDVEPGSALTIPLGTRFQFRATGGEPLTFVIATLPPWPVDREEAVEVEGKWPPRVPPRSGG